MSEHIIISYTCTSLSSCLPAGLESVVFAADRRNLKWKRCKEGARHLVFVMLEVPVPEFNSMHTDFLQR